jgi:hypothetical protein
MASIGQHNSAHLQYSPGCLGPKATFLALPPFVRRRGTISIRSQSDHKGGVLIHDQSITVDSQTLRDHKVLGQDSAVNYWKVNVEYHAAMVEGQMGRWSELSRYRRVEHAAEGLS